jgi:hypothetical protein
MAKREDGMYERGFNIGYYIQMQAPHIIERAMSGISGEPKEFFEGIREGQAESKREINKREEKADKKKKVQEDKEYYAHMTQEREKEEAYQDNLKRDAEEKEKRNAQIEQQIKQEFEQDPVEQARLKELEELRGQKENREKGRDDRAKK